MFLTSSLSPVTRVCCCRTSPTWTVSLTILCMTSFRAKSTLLRRLSASFSTLVQSFFLVLPPPDCTVPPGATVVLVPPAVDVALAAAAVAAAAAA